MPRPTISDVARVAGASKGAVSFIAGLETVLSEHGHALLLQVAEHDDLAAYRRLASGGRVDGVLVTDLTLDDARPALLAELGLPAGVEADFSAESGAATRTLLDLAEPSTAVVYANDLTAMAGMSVAAARGVRIPEDLSVTGFDVALSAYLQPALTTVSTDVVAWGRGAATTLLDLVHQRPTTPVDLPLARLVVRASTGPDPHGKQPTRRSRARSAAATNEEP